jgi:hypothetical protein
VKNILVLRNRALVLDMFVSGPRVLCRFPMRGDRHSYFDLQNFEGIEAIESLQYDTECEECLERSTTMCVARFDETSQYETIEFDCTPDELVDILRVYRQMMGFASFVAGISGR